MATGWCICLKQQKALDLHQQHKEWQTNQTELVDYHDDVSAVF